MAGDTDISPGLLLYPSLLGRTGSTTETLARVEVVANWTELLRCGRVAGGGRVRPGHRADRPKPAQVA
jgi:hypothetical protein